MEDSKIFPALFLGHGSPLNAFEKENKYFRTLQRFVKTNIIPDSIVILSAHWETNGIMEITGKDDLNLELTEETDNQNLNLLIKSVKGNPTLARSISYTLKKKGITTKLNNDKGIDQGAWIPIHLMYPEMNIPIVQLSLLTDKKPKDLYKLGIMLRAFRKENILFIGSGNVVHNSKIRHHDKDAQISGWAIDFDTWLEENMFGDIDDLFDYKNTAPNSNYAVPTPEHFNPIFFVLGLRYEFEKIKTIYEGFEYSTTSMRSFQISI